MANTLAGAIRAGGKIRLPELGGAGRVECVQVDGLVVLKILKHARENPHEQVMGPLLGLVVENNLEITHCFPFPRVNEEETDESRVQDTQYQMVMMRCLREVNVDHLQVGWYQSATLGSYFNEALVQQQYEHQKQIEESVVLIYDPLQTDQGLLSIKAFKLTPSFMATFEKGDFSVEALRSSNLTYESIFEEVAVVIKTSHLGLAMIDSLQTKADETQIFDRLDLSTNTFLGKNINLLMDCVDDLSSETQKYTYHQRSIVRQQQQQKQYHERRKLQQAQRIAEGQDPLPEEDTKNNPLFKPLTPPSRLESLLITGQMAEYCKHISQFSANNFGKLFTASGVQGGLDE